jgi:hypothetical protein
MENMFVTTDIKAHERKTSARKIPFKKGVRIFKIFKEGVCAVKMCWTH